MNDIKTYSKGSITIAIGYGDKYRNPEEVNLDVFDIPYIKYENVWYKCKKLIKVNIANKIAYHPVINYLTNNNYSEEVFLDKILNVIL